MLFCLCETGLLPQMELRMHTPSFQPPLPESEAHAEQPQADEEGNVVTKAQGLFTATSLFRITPPGSPNLDNMKWDTAIPDDKALADLEVAFFDFKKVPYLPYLDAFEAARQQQKLVHLILLWGVLDDQSC